jgi:hypothetical protein
MDIMTGRHTYLLESNYNFTSLITLRYGFNVVINSRHMHYISLQEGLQARTRTKSDACTVGRIKCKIIYF